MTTVIETLAEYQNHIQYEKRCKPETIRGIDASLRSFTELYGTMETTDLRGSDFQLFFDLLKSKKRKKRNALGEYATVGDAYVHKVLKHLRTYVKRLFENGYLKGLTVSEIPTIRLQRKFPEYLTKEEIGLILQHLETALTAAKESGNIQVLYAAYLKRALIWFLYTTGLRNFEIRKVTLSDLRLDSFAGSIIGKGDKLAVFTYSSQAKEKLMEFLDFRKRIFPGKRFTFLFTPYIAKPEDCISAYGLNIILKKTAAKVGIEKNLYAHLMRHSLGTHLVMDGRNIVHVRDKLRHTNVSVTSIYTHSNPDVLNTMTNNLGKDLLGND